MHDRNSHSADAFQIINVFVIIERILNDMFINYSNILTSIRSTNVAC